MAIADVTHVILATGEGGRTIIITVPYTRVNPLTNAAAGEGHGQMGGRYGQMGGRIRSNAIVPLIERIPYETTSEMRSGVFEWLDVR